MRISCRLMCAGLIGLLSLPTTGCSNEEDEVTEFIRSFGEQHFPSEIFFNLPNAITPLGSQRWETTKATGNYGFAIIAVNNKMRPTKRILSKLCSSALSQPFREKLVEQVARELSITIKQDELIKLSKGKFILTNLKRKPIQEKGDFLLTGCEAEVKRINPKKTKLTLHYRLSRYLLERGYYEDAARVAKTLLKNKEFVDNATAIIATAGLNLESEGAVGYIKKIVHIDLINDPKVLSLLSKAASRGKMKNLTIRATNRCLQLKPGDKDCLDIQLDILVDEKKYNQDDFSNLESYLHQ